MIIQLSAKYQFGVIRTATTTDGKVTNRARLSSWFSMMVSTITLEFESAQ